MQFKDLFETASEMQAGFMTLANLLLMAWTRRILTLRRDRPLHDLHDLPVGAVDETFQHGRHFKKLPDQLAAFVKQAAKQHMRIVAVEQTGDTKGQYFARRHQQPEIDLFYDAALFAEHRDQINGGNASILHRFLTSRYDTLIHELRHAYDDFASTGKYRFSPETAKAGEAKAQAKDDATRELAHQAYLLQPHEISARFTQTVATLPYPQGSWRDYRDQFTQRFYGWSPLPPDVKMRLLKRLATHWIDANGQRQPTDIKPFIARLNAKLGDSEIGVYPAHGNIEITGLARESPPMQAKALQQVAYLADIFRRQVVTSDNVPMLKGFDFVRNQGRNIDYRISAQYRREPRR
jgi:hypothetical protein